MGNRLSKQDSASDTTNSTFDAADRLTGTTGAGASAYTSDVDGNTLTGTSRTNAWDSQNRLVSCLLGGNASTYKYGADGLRRQKTTSGAATDCACDATTLVREGQPRARTLSFRGPARAYGPSGRPAWLMAECCLPAFPANFFRVSLPAGGRRRPCPPRRARPSPSRRKTSATTRRDSWSGRSFPVL